MANTLDANGLTLNTYAETVALLEAGFKSIYGADINTASDTPDGQMIALFAQMMVDQGDLLLQIYNSLDPDTAIGNTLDRRASFNGIQRQGGTYSKTFVTITNSRTVTLYGLDQEVEPVYTVSDDEGNEWQLLTTVTLSSGSTSIEFQAAIAGEQLTTQNTITTANTVVLGVTSVNNPLSQSYIGTDTESDYDFRNRRRRSVALASRGFLESLIAALENVEGITHVSAYENATGSTDADGIPAHGMWAIVAGTYTDADIANAIYLKRDGGMPMKGSNTYNVTRPDGSLFEIKWDDVAAETIFIEITLESINGSATNYAGIREAITENYDPGVYETVNTNVLASIVNEIDPNALITASGFSTTIGGTYTSKLTPTAKNNQFSIVEANVVLLPILLLPSSNTVTNGETIQFSSLGGYGAYTYSLQVDNSGASINASTGEYTAGGSDGTDTVRVTDADGNFTDVNVVVA